MPSIHFDIRTDVGFHHFGIAKIVYRIGDYNLYLAIVIDFSKIGIHVVTVPADCHDVEIACTKRPSERTYLDSFTTITPWKDFSVTLYCTDKLVARFLCCLKQVNAAIPTYKCYFLHSQCSIGFSFAPQTVSLLQFMTSNPVISASAVISGIVNNSQ